ncbi:MAG: hypothetical protein JSW50_11970 [Candidatus Latescibacterota bacterium]|nr:MAG: hypothetical protein JSW50_11970 [Candidatus Latescibacterota bacterium]
MKLKQATLAAIIALCVILLTKTLATLFPVEFGQQNVARVTITLTALAGLAVAHFYYRFYRDYTRADQRGLRRVSLLAAVAAAAMAVLYIKGFLIVYDLSVIDILERMRFLDAIVPWLATAIYLEFFIVLWGEVKNRENSRLKNAVRLALIGSVVMIAERTLMLYSYHQFSAFDRTAGLPESVYTAAIPFILFAAGSVLYFFVVFYGELRPVSTH